MAARIEGTPTDMCRTIFLQTDSTWMQYGLAGAGLWHQCRIRGVVAAMKDSRRVMILTLDGEVYVEDSSG